jgi:hypothetical protein
MSILTMCLFLEPNHFSMVSYFRNIGLATVGNIMGAILMMTLPAYDCLWLRWKKVAQQQVQTLTTASMAGGQVGQLTLPAGV